jgi:D-arabinose 1-dehydrogenase-like Zn-dependent alcohol dehydrogenase
MFFEGYNIESSLVASRADHDTMLRFVAHHGITPVVEKFEMSELGIKQALERLESGQMRYRGVLVAA